MCIRDRLLLDKPIQLLLTDLVKEGIIIDWDWQSFRPNKPTIVVCSVQPKIPAAPSGKEFFLQGALGGGVGYTLNQAVRPALAESLERRALCTWGPDKFKVGSFSTLVASGAINPLTLF